MNKYRVQKRDNHILESNAKKIKQNDNLKKQTVIQQQSFIDAAKKRAKGREKQAQYRAWQRDKLNYNDIKKTEIAIKDREKQVHYRTRLKDDFNYDNKKAEERSKEKDQKPTTEQD